MPSYGHSAGNGFTLSSRSKVSNALLVLSLSFGVVPCTTLIDSVHGAQHAIGGARRVGGSARRGRSARGTDGRTKQPDAVRRHKAAMTRKTPLRRCCIVWRTRGMRLFFLHGLRDDENFFCDCRMTM